MIESIKFAEYEWFLWLNSHHSPFFDTIMYWISHRFTWLPLYFFLIFLIFKFIKSQPFQKLFYLIIVVGLADRITSGFMKPYFERLRPCHDPTIGRLVHVVGDCGGQYGFVSSHAANSFALSMGIYLIFHQTEIFNDSRFTKLLRYLLFIWAIIVSYSRIYNGVHYPTDVIFGALIGIFISIFIYFVLNKSTNNSFSKTNNQ